LAVIGSLYTYAKGDSVLPGFTTGTLEFSDTGTLSVSGTEPLVQELSLTPANHFELVDPVQDKLKVSVNAATGLFKGTFYYPGQKKPTDFSGVLFQDQTIGGGFFLGPDGSGPVSLMPAP
jgi:hypothetical protein